MTRQLALPFAGRAHFTFAGFVRGEANEAAWRWLSALEGRLAVYGGAGVGKTHLLHAFAEVRGGVLIPGEAVRYWVDLPEGGVIAVDDADAAPEPEALLHLLNGAAEAGVPVVLAGRGAPAQWAVGLADLGSRLRAVAAVEVGAPDDDLLAAMLARFLAERQLRVESDVQAYLLTRLPRQAGALRAACLRLDRAGLVAGCRVGRGLAACVLAEMGLDDGVEDGSPGAAALL